MLLLASCDEPIVREAAPFTVTDSAGVELILNGEPDPARPDTMPLHELLRIGTADGPSEYQFFRITRMAVDALDRLWVADLNGPVRVYDRDGIHVRDVGREGEGPGEFLAVARIQAMGDRVLVVDSRLRRATLMDSSGTVVGALPLNLESGMLLPDGVGEGRWIGRLWLNAGWPYEVDVTRRDTTFIVTAPDPFIDPDRPSALEEVDTIARYAGPRLTGVAMSNGMALTSPLWEPQPIHRVDGHGRIYLSSGDPWEIDVLSPAGRMVRRIRRAIEPVRIDDRMFDRYFDLAGEYYDTVSRSTPAYEMSRNRYRALRAQPRNENVPALGLMFVAGDGTIWIERPDRHPDPVALEWTLEPGEWGSRWDVVAPDGHWLGEVHLPEKFRPLVVTGTEVFGVERDDLEIEYVVGYGFDAGG